MILKIKQLECSYNSGKDITLRVQDLNFEKGQIYFIIGKSGVGKSTFIEAMGLMSDTITWAEDNTVQFYKTSSNGSTVDLKALWSSGDISKFRAENYSFIFQNNNLMENFTAGENMSFGMLLNGQTLDSARNEIFNVMESVDLPQVLYDRRITNLSGGQRQRLSFVRAITAPFNVLFCDEPTGNLDSNVANKLMNVLKNEVVKSNKTAIIVSHNIDLAIQFADYIIYISESDDNSGYIGQSNVITSNDSDQWYDYSRQDIEDVNAYLTQKIS